MQKASDNRQKYNLYRRMKSTTNSNNTAKIKKYVFYYLKDNLLIKINNNVVCSL